MKKSSGFSFIEVLGVILLCGVVFVTFVLPLRRGAGIHALDKAKLAAASANARDIAKVCCLIDSDDPNVRSPNWLWPGTNAASLAHWMNSLTNYAETNVLVKLFSCGETKASSWSVDKGPNVSAYYIYPMTRDSDPNTVLLTSRNYLLPTSGHGPALEPESKPFGNKGAVVVKKDGHALVITALQATNPISSIGIVEGAPLN